MAVQENIRTAPIDFGVSRAAYRLVSMISDWNDARVTRKALSGLTDRELDDIGLTRGDIDGVATPRF